jgi:hypothetical protein
VTFAEPTTPEGVTAAVLDLVSTRPGRVRLAVDGAPAAEAHALAEAVVAAHGRAVHVRAESFWRPAGQRFEHGRQDVDDWLDVWLDEGALAREVLLRAVEKGDVVPAIRDPRTDRSVRSTPVPVPDLGAVVVSGSGLLGRWLPFDVTVHLQASPAALMRRLPDEDAWLVEAVTRYAEERRPAESADLVVRVEDPRRPALVRRVS